MNRTTGNGSHADPPRATPPRGGDEPGARASGLIALRFGAFELDLRTNELRKGGLLVKLQRQPARVLELLAGRAGELVTREDIRRELWGADTFVDFDQGLNFCVRQVRGALGDDAARPSFVETLPRRGYRFLAPVERVHDAPEAGPVAPEPTRTRPPEPAPLVRARRRRLALTATSLALAAGAAWLWAPDRPAPSAEPRKLALAVLPLDNLSGDPDQEYWSDGLTEELITQLARLDPARLAVIARTSSMAYKGRRIDVARVARELGVDYVIEGSLRRAEGRVRVAAQLIRASDQTHVWAGAYDDDEADVLAAQQDVSRRIVATLAEHLLPTGPATLPAPASADPAAYHLYLRGRHLWGRGTAETLRKSRELLEQALLRDPGFAPAHAALARTWLAIADRSVQPALESFPQAKAAAARALSLDPTLADPHVVLGIVKGYYEWDLQGARTEFERALRLAPGSADAHHALGDYWSALGRHDEAVAAVKRAITLDPVSVAVRQDLGWYLYFGRRHAEAVEAFQHALEFDPEDRDARAGLAMALWHAGRRDASVREQAALQRKLGLLDAARETALLALAPERAQRELLLLARERNAGLWGYMLPAMLGERDTTLNVLERVAERRGRYLLVFVAGDPRLDFLRAEPRFQALRARLGLAGEGPPPAGS